MNFLAEPPFLPSPSSDAALADEAQERYCALASASSLVVWGTTPSGEFFERETGWQEFTGQSPQDARGFGWLAQVHPDDVVPLHAVWSRAAQTEQPFETEYRVHHHSGEFRRVRARGVPVRQNGEVVEWIGTLTDIEDARRAQQLLSEEQERLRFALAVSGTGVWDWDIVTGRLEWNDGFHHLFGHNAQTPRFIADFLAFVHQDDAQTITTRLRAAMQTDDVAEMEYRLVHPDGQVVWARAMGRVFTRDQHGTATRMMGVISDVTAQKEAEGVLRRSHAELHSQAQQAREELAELRRRLVARMVEAQEDERLRLSRELHDQMGQNLTVVAMNLRSLGEYVRGSTDVLRRDDPDFERELDRRLVALQSAVGAIGEQTDSLARELRPPALDTLGLPAALRQCVDEWSKSANIQAQFNAPGLEFNRGQEPRARFGPDIEVALYRVVQEALTNAARHSGACNVNVVLQKSGGDVRVLIEDDGRGFESEGGFSKRLGLVGMRERLEAVGGDLQIESETGRGTTIFATVPLVEANGSGEVNASI